MLLISVITLENLSYLILNLLIPTMEQCKVHDNNVDKEVVLQVLQE